MAAPLSLEHCPWHSLKYPCFVVTTECSSPVLIIPALWHGINYPPRNTFRVIYSWWCFSFNRLGFWILLFLLYKVYLTSKFLLHWQQQAKDKCASPPGRDYWSCCRLWRCCPNRVFKYRDDAEIAHIWGLHLWKWLWPTYFLLASCPEDPVCSTKKHSATSSLSRAAALIIQLSLIVNASSSGIHA